MDCSICLSQLNSEAGFTRKLCCGHTFDSICVEAWLTKTPSCPLCRSEELSFEGWLKLVNEAFYCGYPKLHELHLLSLLEYGKLQNFNPSNNLHDTYRLANLKGYSKDIMLKLAEFKLHLCYGDEEYLGDYYEQVREIIQKAQFGAYPPPITGRHIKNILIEMIAHPENELLKEKLDNYLAMVRQSGNMDNLLPIYYLANEDKVELMRILLNKHKLNWWLPFSSKSSLNKVIKSKAMDELLEANKYY